MGISTIVSFATGIVSSFLKNWLQEKKLDKENDRELARIDREAKVTAAEFNGKERIAKVEQETTKDINDSKNLIAALKHDKASYLNNINITDIKEITFFGPTLIFLLGMVDVVRGMLRPVATIWGLTWVSGLVKQPPTGMEKVIIYASIDLTALMVGYWFGDRMKEVASKLKG